MNDLTDYERPFVYRRRFEVYREIDEGSFKSVWVAMDHVRQQMVALSILHPWCDTDDNAEMRFKQEAHILGHLAKDLPDDLRPFSRRIITLLDSGELEDEPPFKGLFMTTPLKVGSNLREIFREQGVMSWRDTVNIMIGVMEALQVCHTPTIHRGPVIHRDLKPANIIVGLDNDVTVLDFGVSKMVRDTTRPEQSAVVGTAAYMAPEQFEMHATLRPQTDLYAAGVIFHQLLTGELPWAISTFMELLQLMKRREEGQEEPLPLLEAVPVPDDLRQLVHDCLAFVPEDRPSSAFQVRERLIALCSTDTEPVRIPSSPMRVDGKDLALASLHTLPTSPDPETEQSGIQTHRDLVMSQDDAGMSEPEGSSEAFDIASTSDDLCPPPSTLDLISTSDDFRPADALEPPSRAADTKSVAEPRPRSLVYRLKRWLGIMAIVTMAFAAGWIW